MAEAGSQFPNRLLRYSSPAQRRMSERHRRATHRCRWSDLVAWSPYSSSLGFGRAWRECVIGTTIPNPAQLLLRLGAQSCVRGGTIFLGASGTSRLEKTCGGGKNCVSYSQHFPTVGLRGQARIARLLFDSTIESAQRAASRIVVLGAALSILSGANAANAKLAREPQQSTAEQRLPGQKAPTNGAVEGILRGANNKPLAGATVELKNESTKVIFTTTSDVQGVFRFLDVPPGSYELIVRSAGYRDSSNPEMHLKAGDDLVCQVALEAIPVTAPAAQIPELPSGDLSTGANPQSSAQPELPPALQGTPPSDNAQKPAPLPSPDQVFRTEPDRWIITMPNWDRYGIGGEYPYVKGNRWDPFNRNKLKGDEPIIGKQTFLNLTAISDTFADGRRLPVPSNVSSAQDRKSTRLN